MKDVQDMTDDEWCLYQARQRAAVGYRAEGFDDFAREVERGEHDECQLMRIARFMIEPSQLHGDEFIAAWNEFATNQEARRSTA